MIFCPYLPSPSSDSGMVCVQGQIHVCVHLLWIFASHGNTGLSGQNTQSDENALYLLETMFKVVTPVVDTSIAPALQQFHLRHDMLLRELKGESKLNVLDLVFGCTIVQQRSVIWLRKHVGLVKSNLRSRLGTSRCSRLGVFVWVEHDIVELLRNNLNYEANITLQNKPCGLGDQSQ